MRRPTTEEYEFPVVSGSHIVLKIEGDVIAGIDFTNRPRLSSGQQREYKGYEACHRIGLPIIKREICNAYLGKTLDTAEYPRLVPLSSTNIRKSKIENLGKYIAKRWKEAVRDSNNLFAGDPAHNNFSGKLCLLLRRYIERGEAAFRQQLQEQASNVLKIPMPRNYYAFGDNDFYRTVRETLGADSIEVSSWVELCEWYFGVNYDESPDQKLLRQPSVGGFRALFSRRETSTSPMEDKHSEHVRRDAAMIRFKKAYQLHGLCGQTSTTPEEKLEEKTGEGTQKRRRTDTSTSTPRPQ